MRSPVILFLALFAAGVVMLQTRTSLPPYAPALTLAGAAGCIVAQMFLARNGRRWLAVAASAALIGFGYAAWRADVRLSDALPPQWEGVDIRIVGVVDDLPQPVDRGARFTFAVERILTEGATVPAHVSLGWYAQRAKGDDVQDIPA